MNARQTLDVAILGSGIIGADLLHKTLGSPVLRARAFLGRDPLSAGLSTARSLGVPVSADGIGYLEENPSCCDLVFDATSAGAHVAHAPVLERLGMLVV